ncbi:MAG: SH3 domain-containing protein [Hungatella sp.]|nr:SH3 domain-containing protein [Hungatella sp.]
MKKRKFRQGLALVMTLFMTINYAGSYLGRSPVVSLADTLATVNATSLNVRSGPGTNYGAVGKLAYGSSVSVTGESRGSDGKVWYQIRFTKNGAESSGYVRSDYIKFPTAYQSDGDFERYLSNQGFPESYKQGLRQLHAEYPNWVFTAQHTNLEWKEVIDNESVVGRNLVPGSSISSWKSMEAGAYNWETGTWPSFDSGSWVAASREIISYYMDPRNFLNEKYVFQFLKHKYNSSIHTIDGVKNMVQGTFLDNSVDVSKSQSSGENNIGPGFSSGSQPGTGTNGDSNDYGPGVSGSSGGNPGASGSPGGGSATVQPGVRPGEGASQSGGNPGAGNTPQSEGNPAGTHTVQPGAGPGSTGQPQGSQGGGSATVQPGVRPGASVSKKEGNRVATAIGPSGLNGPGETSGPGTSQGPGVSSGGGTYSAPIASYAEIIMNAAAQSGVNPYVLTAMILQEQGSQGSRGVSGKVSGYEGYYNFFNIEAYQSGSLSAIERGLWYASQSGSYERPWNSVDKAILGGAVYYGTNYVNAGQDTFYLKKFNVQGNNLYKHQYMTNVEAAAAEGAKLQEAYNSQLKQLALEFKIPVYKNMPDQPCEKPTSAGNPNNKLSSLSVDGFTLTPTFNKDVTSYTIIAGSEVTTVNVRATALDSKAVITGIGNIQLQSGNTDITIQVKAQNGTVCQYVIHVVRQSNSPDSGFGPGTSQAPGAAGGPGSGSLDQSQSPGNQISIEIITGGPGQSSGGSGSGHTGPGGSNVTIVQ